MQARACWQHTLGALSRAVRCANLSPLDLPDAGAYAPLGLAAALLRLAPVRELWLAMPKWHELLEGLLSIKAPTARDLRLLVPFVHLPRGVGPVQEVRLNLRLCSLAVSMQQPCTAWRG